ncbi:hypothetical protein N7510_011823 [Penicillium lagena]|uniref:uncharacterized protein n=1 Tax=Penicillium lagena TaxID=94218 RepID=UPI00254051E4|nr:uncharacterized protein N7510_011823 [Penicillium lagena]KAJ5602289.1 hypothetical protein N7510_011823 [Penicillium lagena]
MAESINANTFFQPNNELGVAICRRCEYAVRPREIIRHLTKPKGAHVIPHSVAEEVLTQIVNTWPNVRDEPTNLPQSVGKLIPGLTIYNDGILCTFCGYVCRTMESIRKHWRTQHGFSPYDHSRKPRPSEVPAGQDARDQAMRRVVCQRVFYRRLGSHYIHVRQPGPNYEPARPPPQANVVNELIQQLEQTYVDSQAPDDRTIQAGPLDEANPWLRRTQHPPRDILQSIKTPPEDAQGPEGAMRAIWDAIDGVARISQRITKQTGHLIRVEAARTEKDQSPHEPLQAYMDEEQIQRHVEPWQQILMFFARTQVEHDWPSPPYRFTPRQRRAWQALWRHAQDTRGSPDPFDHPSQTQSQGDGGDDPYQMTPIQTACMDFCIELLNQRASAEEYECALICALAVLGQGRDRWRDADSYPPILSKTIKISRFMVLHKALRLDPNAKQILQYMRDRHEVGK